MELLRCPLQSETCSMVGHQSSNLGFNNQIDLGDEDDTPIPIPNVSAVTLTKVIEFCKMHKVLQAFFSHSDLARTIRFSPKSKLRQKERQKSLELMPNSWKLTRPPCLKWFWFDIALPSQAVTKPGRKFPWHQANVGSYLQICGFHDQRFAGLIFFSFNKCRKVTWRDSTIV